MSAEQLTAIGGIIAAIGVPLVAFMTFLQGRTLRQVERQGNSVALEQKRVTAAALRTAAAVTKSPVDEAKAKDAETLYEKAKEQAEQNSIK